jgi:L-lysine 2,3-aminomutase
MRTTEEVIYDTLEPKVAINPFDETALEMVKECMKAYAKEALELAAENGMVSCKHPSRNEPISIKTAHIDQADWEITVDKQSILSLINDLK